MFNFGHSFMVSILSYAALISFNTLKPVSMHMYWILENLVTLVMVACCLNQTMGTDGTDEFTVDLLKNVTLNNGERSVLQFVLATLRSCG